MNLTNSSNVAKELTHTNESNDKQHTKAKFVQSLKYGKTK